LQHEDIQESEDMALPFLTSALDGGEWLASGYCRFISGESALGTYYFNEFKKDELNY
jgi:hypothetical protein